MKCTRCGKEHSWKESVRCRLFGRPTVDYRAEVQRDNMRVIQPEQVFSRSGHFTKGIQDR